ncbi:MAG: hypothetical protein HP496_11140 [Nitrospira sp.]|nr:hypothetical protein [Nitrospira sp.]
MREWAGPDLAPRVGNQSTKYHHEPSISCLGGERTGAQMVNDAPIPCRVGRLLTMMVASVVLASCDSAMRQLDRPTGASPVIQTKGWHMHTDPTYGFAVDYPKGYVILKERTLPTPTQPPAVQRVRIQLKDIAAGHFADLEPPALTIHVFSRSSGRSLREWLDSFGLLPLGCEMTAVPLAGAREGVRVSLRQQLAPNEFFYFATDRFVYGLIPFGHESANMLRSFRLTGTP